MTGSATDIHERISAPPRARLSADNRNLLIALAGVSAVVFALVASNVAANHEPKPHNLPVGRVGSPQATGALAGQLQRSDPGALKALAYNSRAAARTAILHRKVYGAFQPGRRPSLLVASAASPPVEALLRTTFQAATRGRPQTLVVRDLASL